MGLCEEAMSTTCTRRARRCKGAQRLACLLLVVPSLFVMRNQGFSIGNWRLSLRRKLTGITWGQSTGHSFVHCRRSDNYAERICDFQNVCFDRLEREFVFFEDPKSLQQMLPLERGMGLVDFTNIVPTRAHVSSPLSFRVERSFIPSHEAARHNRTVHVVFDTYWAENYGHVLGDDVLPVASLMQNFGFQTLDVQVMSIHDCCARLGLGSSEYKQGKGFLESFISLLSSHPMLDMSQDAPFYPVEQADLIPVGGAGAVDNATVQPRYVCMDHLLAGHGSLGLYYDKNLAWPTFVNTLLRSAAERWSNVAEAMSLPLSSQHIVILKKVGRRRVINTDEMATFLRNTFAVSVTVIDPSTLDLAAQISIAQRASVLVSPCGGISFFASFMRKHATAVIIGYWDTKKNSSVNMEGFFWRWLTRQTDFYYDVKKEEVVVENVPQEYEKDEWLRFRNYGSTRISLPRMARIVHAALYHSEHMLGLEQGSFSTLHLSEYQNAY